MSKERATGGGASRPWLERADHAKMRAKPLTRRAIWSGDSHAQATNAQDDDQDDGCRPAYRRARRSDAASGARRHGHRVPSRRPAAQRVACPPTRGTSAIRGCRRRSGTDGASISTVEHVMSALAGLGIDNAARRRRRSRDPDHGRQRGAVRVPAAVGGDRRAGRREEAICGSSRRSRCATATSGRASTRSTASSSTSRSIFRTRCSGRRTGRSSSISPSTPTSRKWRARERSVSCRTSRRCAPPASAWAAACRTPIVLDDVRVLNAEGLRYDNEFVKHKVLDAIGDLYLLGHPLIGQYTGLQIGARSQQRARARRSCSGPTRYEFATFKAEDDVPTAFQDWQLAPADRRGPPAPLPPPPRADVDSSAWPSSGCALPARSRPSPSSGSFISIRAIADTSSFIGHVLRFTIILGRGHRSCSSRLSASLASL